MSATSAQGRRSDWPASWSHKLATSLLPATTGQEACCRRARRRRRAPPLAYSRSPVFRAVALQVAPEDGVIARRLYCELKLGENCAAAFVRLRELKAVGGFINERHAVKPPHIKEQSGDSVADSSLIEVCHFIVLNIRPKNADARDR